MVVKDIKIIEPSTIENIDSAIFGTGKFYQEKEDEKKENIYTEIDDMLSSTLDKENDDK